MFFDYLILLQLFELFAAFDLYDYDSDGWQSVA